MTVPGSLNAARRTRELDTLASGAEVDVLVVGGGVTGAGVALDAASRGLSVALIESEDLAFGTSRASSKLVHGGLRYLAHGEIGLAHESARERGILMTRTAPHLTRALAQVFPFYGRGSLSEQAIVAAGLYAGDALRAAVSTPAQVLPRPRRIPAPEALALAPGLEPDGLRSGLLAFDGALTDDARLVVSLARTASREGAQILTRVRALELDGTRVRARDELTGRDLTLGARQVINATGVWAGELAPSIRLRPSRGSHLVLDAAATGIRESSVMVPVPGERNRFVFLLPQPDGKVYLGLTDEPLHGELPDVPAVPDSDRDFLLRTASGVLARELTRADVLGAYAGLRPLIENAGSGTSADLSRKHAVCTEDNGVLSIVGGKLTTYRRMAQDVVDAAVRAGTIRAGGTRTEWLPLIGAARRSDLPRVRAPQRLVRKYGTEAVRVAALGEVDGTFAHELFPGTDVTAAEVVWAVRHEGALDVEDVLHRRTRLGLVPEQASEAQEPVRDLVQRALRGIVGST